MATTAEMVQAVKDHAEEHYNDGGWDVIVECYDDEMIVEMIGRARTEDGAINKAWIAVKAIKSARSEIMATAF